MAILTGGGGGGGSYEAPPPGGYAFTCVDVCEPYQEEVTWEGKTKKVNKIWFKFAIRDLVNPDAKVFIHREKFTASLNDKGKLLPWIESWLGGKLPLNKQGVPVLDTEELLGRHGLGNITHNTSKSNGKTYANMTMAMPLPPGFDAPVPEKYIRERDRTPDQRRDGPVPNVGSVIEKPGVITAAQHARLKAIQTNRGIFDEQYRGVLKFFGYESGRDIKPEHYEDICTELDALGKSED